ncbi:MAG: hypothetical protein ACI9TH_004188 [Kiritimatiellia bacterium]|jgi:hypothetical protein
MSRKKHRLSTWGLLVASILCCASCNEIKSEGAASGPVTRIGGEEVRHGIWLETYANGTRKTHGRYTRGLPTGLHRTWHANGQPASERRYDWDGKLHKKQVDFNEDGERIAKFFYLHGEEEAPVDSEQPSTSSDETPADQVAPPAIEGSEPLPADSQP